MCFVQSKDVSLSITWSCSRMETMETADCGCCCILVNVLFTVKTSPSGTHVSFLTYPSFSLLHLFYHVHESMKLLPRPTTASESQWGMQNTVTACKISDWKLDWYESLMRHTRAEGMTQLSEWMSGKDVTKISCLVFWWFRLATRKM